MERIVSGIFDSYDEAEFAARELMGFGIDPQKAEITPNNGRVSADSNTNSHLLAGALSSTPTGAGVGSGASAGGVATAVDIGNSSSEPADAQPQKVYWSVACDESFCNKVAEMIRHKGAHRVDVQ